jgi:8-oxo-dGTP pyrophosphatase MutT (NUDIX family)
MKQATLLFLIEDNRILLAMKKRGFGAGRWNGAGGKPDKGESITETASRECQEEISVTPSNIKEVATLNFYFPDGKKESEQQVIVFTCRTWQGEPSESEEMDPKWFDIDKIPYSEMWSDDQYWLPQVLGGRYINADFYFDDNDNLLRHKIKT